MVARPAHRGAELAEGGLDALAEAAVALGSAASLPKRCRPWSTQRARAAGAEVVVARVADDAQGRLSACAVATGHPRWRPSSKARGCGWTSFRDRRVEPGLPSRGRAAGGERVHASELSSCPFTSTAGCGAAGAHAQRRSIRGCRTPGRAALRRAGGPRDPGLRAGAPWVVGWRPDATLALAGRRWPRGADGSRTADQVIRLAVEATGAFLRTALGTRVGAADPRRSSARRGRRVARERRRGGRRALLSRDPLSRSRRSRASGNCRVAATLQARQPSVGGLQLLFEASPSPGKADLAVLRNVRSPVPRTRFEPALHSRTVASSSSAHSALLAVVGQASRSSRLAHTLETAVAPRRRAPRRKTGWRSISSEDRLVRCGGVGLADRTSGWPALLELALGAFRSRESSSSTTVSRIPLRAIADAARRPGIGRAIASRARPDDVIGLRRRPAVAAR